MPTEAPKSDVIQAVFSVCATPDVAMAAQDAVATVSGAEFIGEFQEYISADKRPEFPPVLTEAVGCVAIIDCDQNPELALETMERLTQTFLHKVSLIAIAAKPDTDFLLRAMRSGCNDFLHKPLDPALFTGHLPADKWKEYLADPRHPLENKALKGMYPPGSTFKIITALAGLEEGLIDAHTSVECPGYYKFGNSTFKCWDKKGHGHTELKKALRESCDVYFYKLAERLGVDRIAKYAKRFGLGAPLGIGLDNEKGGVIPTEEWKLKRYGKKWYQGETLSVGIGQGYVLTTPVQLASMIATVANEGTVYQPHLVKRIVDSDGRTLKEFPPQVTGKTGIKPENYRLVKDGLFAVVNEPHGTGALARLSEVKVAGKTGSAQVVKLRDSKGQVPYQFRDHALFVAFAPYEKPEIAIAVIVEHAEHGGSAAAPIAGKLFRAYFEGKGVIKKPVSKKQIPEGDETDGGAAAGAGTGGPAGTGPGAPAVEETE